MALALDSACPLTLTLSPGGGEGRIRWRTRAYPFDLSGDALRTVDLRPLWRALAADVLAGALPGLVSARFHAALSSAGAALIREARATPR